VVSLFGVEEINNVVVGDAHSTILAITRPNLKIDNKLKTKRNRASLVSAIIAQMFVTN